MLCDMLCSQWVSAGICVFPSWIMTIYFVKMLYVAILQGVMVFVRHDLMSRFLFHVLMWRAVTQDWLQAEMAPKA